MLKFTVPLMALCLVFGSPAQADEVPVTSDTAPARNQRIQMHEVPSVSGRVDEKTDYTFGERSDEFRLRENSLNGPAPVDPRLFAPPTRSERAPERKKNWLTPKSNLSRIQNKDEEASSDEKTERADQERGGQGWLVEDVMNRQQERGDKRQEDENPEESTDEEGQLREFQTGEREVQDPEESESAFSVFEPTSDFLAQGRPGQADEDGDRFSSAISANSANATDADETQKIYEKPIQWGGDQAAESSGFTDSTSVGFMTSDTFSPSSSSLGAMDRLNENLYQQFSQPSTSREGGDSLSGTRGVASGSLGQTSGGLSSPFSRSPSSERLTGQPSGPRTTSSAGFSGWSPSGPQEPLQAFDSLSDQQSR